MVSRMLAAFVSFSVPFGVGFGYIRNNFYHHGAPFLDAGWFAALMWTPDWSLANPPVVLVAPDFPPRHFYSIHFAPILAIVSFVRQALPLDRVDLFASYMGLGHGLLALFMFYLVSRLKEGIVWSTVSAGLSIAFGLNGLAAMVTTYPHYEILAPGLALFALVFLMERRLALAWMFGALALLVREDIGFHIVAVLGLLLVFELARTKSIRAHRDIIIFAAACLVYSIGAMAAQKLLFPSVSAFAWVYTGDRPFSHLTVDMIEQRLVYLFTSRGFAWMPLALILVIAAVKRSVPVAIGAIAFVPWFLLQLLAASSYPPTFGIHYTFPFLIGIGWSAIALARLMSPYALVACLAATVGLTFVSNPQARILIENASPRGFASSPSATIEFSEALKDSLPHLGKVKVDWTIMSLAPDGLTADAWLPQDWGGRKLDPSVNAMIFFSHSPEKVNVDKQIQLMGNVTNYSVPGTNIRVTTTKPIDPRLSIAPLLRPE